MVVRIICEHIPEYPFEGSLTIFLKVPEDLVEQVLQDYESKGMECRIEEE